MLYLNKFELIGNLTQDVEVQEHGSSFLYKLSIAVNWGTEDNQVDYFNVDHWRKDGSFAQYLQKGKQVMVEGRIKPVSKESDGETRRYTNLVAYKIQLGSNPRSLDESKPGETSEEVIDPDNIPF